MDKINENESRTNIPSIITANEDEEKSSSTTSTQKQKANNKIWLTVGRGTSETETTKVVQTNLEAKIRDNNPYAILADEG